MADPKDHARMLEELGDTAGSMTAWRQVLDVAPDDVDALFALGRLYRKDGKFADALDMMAQAAIQAPDNADLQNAWGALLLSVDRKQDAAAAFHRAADAAPEAPEARCNLAATLLDIDGPETALPVFDKLVEDHPGFLHGWFGQQECLILLDRLEDARRSITACHKRHPRAQMSRAHDAFIALKCGQENTYRNQYDLATFPKELPLDLPEQYPTRPAFHQAIRRAVMQSPTLEWDILKQGLPPRGFARDLEKNRNPALRAFQHQLETALQKWIATLEPVDGHPFLGSIPDKWHVIWWCTMLKGSGQHRVHNHEGGWLSGVYYLSTGDAASRNDQAGWIRFGDAGHYVPECDDNHWHKPEEGRFLVFPSYLLHGTSPWQGNDLRLSLSFDLIPED